MQPTRQGYLASIQDVHLLLWATQQYQLPIVSRRLSVPERRALIRSGSIFLYTECQSHIKRWTDGRLWSPSRIVDEFLLYRELALPFPPGEKRSVRPQHRPRVADAATTTQICSSNHTSLAEDLPRRLTGSLIRGYTFKKNGLFKKTVSITDANNEAWHIVSYYLLDDVLTARLHSLHHSMSQPVLIPSHIPNHSGETQPQTDHDGHLEMVSHLSDYGSTSWSCVDGFLPLLT